MTEEIGTERVSFLPRLGLGPGMDEGCGETPTRLTGLAVRRGTIWGRVEISLQSDGEAVSEGWLGVGWRLDVHRVFWTERSGHRHR